MEQEMIVFQHCFVYFFQVTMSGPPPHFSYTCIRKRCRLLLHMTTIHTPSAICNTHIHVLHINVCVYLLLYMYIPLLQPLRNLNLVATFFTTSVLYFFCITEKEFARLLMDTYWIVHFNIHLLPCAHVNA